MCLIREYDRSSWEKERDWHRKSFWEGWGRSKHPENIPGRAGTLSLHTDAVYVSPRTLSMVYDWLLGMWPDLVFSTHSQKIRQGKQRWRVGGCWHNAFPVWSEGLVESLGDVIFMQEIRCIISEPSGGSTNEKGKEAACTGHVAFSCCLQTPTIRLFPAWRSGNSLVSGKNGSSRNESKNLQRLEGGPLTRKLGNSEMCEAPWNMEQWKCAWSSIWVFPHEADRDSAERRLRVRVRWHQRFLWLFLNPRWWWRGWICPQF